MAAGIWFWIIYVIIGICGGFYGYRSPDTNRTWIGGSFIVYVLIGLLGWGVFGPPIR